MFVDPGKPLSADVNMTWLQSYCFDSCNGALLQKKLNLRELDITWTTLLIVQPWFCGVMRVFTVLMECLGT